MKKENKPMSLSDFIDKKTIPRIIIREEKIKPDNRMMPSVEAKLRCLKICIHEWIDNFSESYVEQKRNIFINKT